MPAVYTNYKRRHSGLAPVRKNYHHQRATRETRHEERESRNSRPAKQQKRCRSPPPPRRTFKATPITFETTPRTTQSRSHQRRERETEPIEVIDGDVVAAWIIAHPWQNLFDFLLSIETITNNT